MRDDEREMRAMEFFALMVLGSALCATVGAVIFDVLGL